MNDLANSTMTQNSPPVRIDFNTPELQRKRRLRAFKDRLTRWYVLVGGLAVLAAITLIFFYLAYVVVPLFQGAELTTKKAMTPTWLSQDAGKPLMISLEEQNLVGMRVSDNGQALFFDTKTGAELSRVALPVPAGTQVTAIGADQPGNPLIVLGLSAFATLKGITAVLRVRTVDTVVIELPPDADTFSMPDAQQAIAALPTVTAAAILPLR